MKISARPHRRQRGPCSPSPTALAAPSLARRCASDGQPAMASWTAWCSFGIAAHSSSKCSCSVQRPWSSCASGSPCSSIANRTSRTEEACAAAAARSARTARTAEQRDDGEGAVSRRHRSFHDFTAPCFSVFTTRWLQVFTTSVVGKSRKKSLIDDSDRVAVYRTDDADRDHQ